MSIFRQIKAPRKNAEAPHPAFGHPLPEGEGKLCPFSLWEKDRMRELHRTSDWRRQRRAGV